MDISAGALQTASAAAHSTRSRRATSGASGRPGAFFVNFAVVWAIGVVMRRLLFLATTGSAWSLPPLPWVERVGLVALGFLAGVPGAIVLAACFTAIGAAARLPRRRGAIVVAFAWGLAYAFEFFGFASWATFYGTREFLNSEALSLSLASPGLMLDHLAQIDLPVLLAVPVVAAVVLAGTRQCCVWAGARSDARVGALVHAASAIIVASMGIAWISDVRTEHDPRAISLGAGAGSESAHDAYDNFASDHSGAIARLLVDGWDLVTREGARFTIWRGGSATGRPVISAADYAHGVDPRAARRLSVIVVLVESLRADELTALGSPRVVLPAVDALAREATVYTDVITPAAQTDYATTSVLSSQFPLRNTSFTPFPAKIPYPRVLLYDLLKPLGYRTAVFSSQNEHWAGMYNYLQTGGIEHFLHAETYHGVTQAPDADRGFANWMKLGNHAGKIDDRNTIDEAIAWTDSIAPAAPFFEYLNLQSSHTPYVAPSHFASRFGSGRVSFPILFDVFPADSAQAVRDMYDNALAYADAQLGRLFEALKRDGRWGSTIVVVLGDHGEAFYEHGYGAHGGQLNREVTHVPMVIRVPGQRAARDTLPAASIDMAPTVLGLLHLPPHPEFQGIDLSSSGPRGQRPRFTLTQTAMADEVAVELDQWKLMYDLRHSQIRLFDLRHDPFETRDVGDAHPAQRDALTNLVAEWWTTQLNYYRTLPAVPRVYAPPAPVRSALTPP